MSLKFKIVFFNLMIFLIIFDIIYFLVWIFSIHMNPAKAVIAAGVAVLFTPWARATNLQMGRKVAIRSFAFVLYHRYIKR